jgi:nitrous oxidase accessory protein NosD
MSHRTEHGATPRRFIAGLACLIGAWAAPVEAGGKIVVPRDYPTIQAAIDAAAPGATVSVRPGTYTEQLRIGKDLTIVGAGAKSTIVRAPSTLLPGALGETAIVEHSKIRGGGGGVWVIADSADSTVVLDRVKLSGLAGPAVGEVECCGFTATVTGAP